MIQEPPTRRSPRFNPWLTIWLQPRATIQRVMQSTSNHTIWILGSLAGIDNALNRAAFLSEGDSRHLFSILSSALTWGALWGMVRLLVSSGITMWVGRRLGGIATMNQVLVALAWSSIPQTINALLWIPQIFFLGNNTFTSTPLLWNSSPIGYTLWVGLTFVGISLSVWQMVLAVLAVAEVHRFSIKRSIVTLIIPFIALLVPLLLFFITSGN